VFFIQVNRSSRKSGSELGIISWYILGHYHMPQDYPRTEEGLLDEGRLAPHTRKIPFDELKARAYAFASGRINIL